MNASLPQVGAPDPELENSPVIDEPEYEEEAESLDLDLGIETALCYFNGVAYPIGTYVQSGSEVLQCTAGGLWARKGEREGPP